MTAENRRRAENAAERPDVQRWIRRFRRLAQDMPEGIMVYVGEGVSVLAKTEDGNYPLQMKRGEESMDPDSVVETISTIGRGQWEGGAW